MPLAWLACSRPFARLDFVPRQWLSAKLTAVNSVGIERSKARFRDSEASSEKHKGKKYPKFRIKALKP